MALDLLKLLAGRPLALDRGALPALAEHAAVQLGGVDLHEARERYAAAVGRSRNVQATPDGDVAIVTLSGPLMPDGFLCWLLGGSSPDSLVQAFEQASAAAPSIIFVVDSPGGSSDLIEETCARIAAINAVTPITTIARCCIASAAYWLASGTSEIIASPSAVLGSIGVWACHYDESGLNARLGVVPTYIVSSASPFKVETNSDAPLSAEALAYEQHVVDGIADTFIANIATGRGVSPAFVRANFGGGRTLTAAASVRAGLADRVDTLQGVMAKARAAGSARRVGRAALTAAQRREDVEDDMLLSDSPAERQLGRETRADRLRGQAERDVLEMELAIRART